MKYIDADKLKAEIERLKSKYRKDMYKSNYEGLASGYKIEAYNELLSFLSTLESEKPMNQEGLEEEMDRYFETMPVLEHENIFEETFKNIARHFAQWGAEHFRDITKMVETPVSDDLEEAADDYIGKVVDDGWEWETHDIVEAFIAGAKWQKEQMMKEAVEGEIQMRYSGCLCAKTIRAINEGKFKFGDKVRVIVLPKED